MTLPIPAFNDSLAKLLNHTLYIDRVVLQKQQLLTSSLDRLGEAARRQADLIGRVAPAVKALDAAVATQSKMLQRDWIQPPTVQFGPLNLGIDRFQRAQLDWVESLREQLDKFSIGKLAVGLSARIDFAHLVPSIETALEAAALEFPDSFGGLEDQLSEVAEEIVGGALRVAEGDVEVAERSILGFISELLTYYGLQDENGRHQLHVIIAVILLAIAGGAMGEALGGEWNRMRDSAADAAERAAWTRLGNKVDGITEEMNHIRELAEHPPRPARVVRRAWLRLAPDSSSTKLGPILEVGTGLVVYERKDGWIRVEAESTPGDVRTGWVYGRLASYQ